MSTFSANTTSNDCESSASYFDAAGAGLRYGKPSTTAFSSGFYFTNVTIPKGATINSAVITVKALASLSGNDVIISIGCVDEDDFNGFSSTAGDRPNDITLTTARASWTVGAQTKDSDYNTPDFASAVKEVVDRDGWASGNDLGVVFRDNGSSNSAYRQARSTSSTAAYITIDYTAASGPANLKTYNTNAAANIKAVNTNAIANVKSLNTNI